MGRRRNPNSVHRKKRNIEAQLARERQLDDLSRKPMRGEQLSIVILDEVVPAQGPTDDDGDEWEYR